MQFEIKPQPEAEMKLWRPYVISTAVEKSSKIKGNSLGDFSTPYLFIPHKYSGRKDNIILNDNRMVQILHLQCILAQQMLTHCN